MLRLNSFITHSRLVQSKRFSPLLALVVVAGTAVTGGYMVMTSQAAGPAQMVEAERGVVSARANVVADTTASGGKAIVLGATGAALPLRAAFYYPWFPETWGSLSNPYTHFHPTAGYYSSDNATVVTRHIQTMTYAGMDAAIASWWGQGSHSESSRIPALLNNSANASNGKDLKWSLYYEKDSVGDPPVAEIAADLTYIKNTYASHDNYLKISGKPVIFVFADDFDGCSMADRWEQANAGLGFYVVLKVFTGYTSCASQPSNWHQYGPANAEDSQPGRSYAISPGFWLKLDSSPRLSRDQSRWSASIDNMIASNAPLQLITTFNEWGEGTAVEPATEWPSASDYGAYVDALHAKLNPGAP